MDLNNLTVGYLTSRNRIAIQKNITATLEPGQFTCMLGPNGAGKSTLLRTLAGFIPSLDGSIIINGRHMSSYSQSQLARLVSVVLTGRLSVSSMTVEQLVALGRSPYTGFWGRLADADRKSVETALELTGTVPLRERLADTLSDGEMQKVMVAKALAQETPVILLDEPTAFLDFPSKAEIMRLLRNLAHVKNKTIFLSSHDINMALVLADSLWLVDRNYGVSIGTPTELADNGSLEKYFLRPGISFSPETQTFSVER